MKNIAVQFLLLFLCQQEQPIPAKVLFLCECVLFREKKVARSINYCICTAPSDVWDLSLVLGRGADNISGSRPWSWNVLGLTLETQLPLGSEEGEIPSSRRSLQGMLFPSRVFSQESSRLACSKPEHAVPCSVLPSVGALEKILGGK